VVSQSGASNIKEKKMDQTDLLKMNVNDHTEKKNGLTYLSWAWAWAEALKADPKARFDVQSFDGKPYVEINGTAMVWVTVTMFDKPMTCMLPVMDSYNKPITIEGVTTINKYNKEVVTKLDSFNVNTAIMRCMTKALAMHGLGLYIYAGEDLPEIDETRGEVKEVTPAAKMKHVAVQPTEWDNSDASRNAFAEMMIKFTSTCSTVADLSSYWASNKLQLDSLKQTHPQHHAQVLSKFSEIKKTLQG
jgi:hypothetical protein